MTKQINESNKNEQLQKLIFLDLKDRKINYQEGLDNIDNSTIKCLSWSTFPHAIRKNNKIVKIIIRPRILMSSDSNYPVAKCYIKLIKQLARDGMMALYDYAECSKLLPSMTSEDWTNFMMHLCDIHYNTLVYLYKDKWKDFNINHIHGYSEFTLPYRLYFYKNKLYYVKLIE